jgi:hypothetical protein
MQQIAMVDVQTCHQSLMGCYAMHAMFITDPARQIITGVFWRECGIRLL